MPKPKPKPKLKLKPKLKPKLKKMAKQIGHFFCALLKISLITETA